MVEQHPQQSVQVLAVIDDPGAAEAVARAVEGVPDMHVVHVSVCNFFPTASLRCSLVATDCMAVVEVRRRFGMVAVLRLASSEHVHVEANVAGADWVAPPFEVSEVRGRLRRLLGWSSCWREPVLAAGVEAEAPAERIRALRSALASLRMAFDGAQQANRTKTSLLRLTAHELRTPLTAARLQIDRRRRGGEAIDPVLEEVVAQLRYSSELVESLLGYGRAESGRLVEEVTAVEPMALAQAAVERVRTLMAHPISVYLCAKTEIPNITTDAQLFHLIVVNLLHNATKFADGPYEVTLEHREGKFRLCVRDCGPGLSMDEQMKIFDPFHQPRSRGGLGLLLVREMVHALHGKLGVTSASGQGTAFVVELPGSMQGRSVDCSGIAVISEDASLAHGIVAMLRAEGYRVPPPINPIELSAFVQARPGPRMVLLDVLLARRFRELQALHKGLSETEIILIADTVDIPRDLACSNTVDCVTKPLRPDDLLLTIRRHLQH